ncbi:MAG TPA: SGNH/GDSL hydrolase family protein [Candidatus Saccharimonadales bacterium]
MRMYTKIVTGVVALVLLLGSAGLFYILAKADAQPSSWLLPNDPTLQQTVSLAANQLPTRQNRDCTPMNYMTTMYEQLSGCMVNTALGLMDYDGNALLYSNTSLAIPIAGYGSGLYGLSPVPNQPMVLSWSSAPVMGMYLHFYTDLLSDLSMRTDASGAERYVVSKAPNVDFPTVDGALVPANPYTISYSSDGSWMVVEDMHYGMLRVNLATFQTLLFAPALNIDGSDYRTHTAATAISDDGRYAIVASNEQRYFEVFDLSTCVPSTKHPAYQDCQSRDLWPYISTHTSGFKGIYSARFTNDDNINFDASYDFTSSTDFKAARFTVTAPGQQSRGLDYLAMGDSYISGQGAFVYRDGTDTADNPCHVSDLAYPFIIGAELPQMNSYESVACSGAKTKDITGNGVANYNSNPEQGAQSKGMSGTSYDDDIYSNFLPGYRTQINFVKKYQPRIVTLSVGGDDIGFANIVKNCVTPAHTNPGDTCYDSYAERLSLAETVAGIYKDLQDTYKAILDDDPGVQLYVVGYPQVAVEGNCALNVHLNSQEIAFSQQLINYLDWTIQQAADSEGVRYVDVQNALIGHRLCETKSSDVAVNGFTVGNDSGALGVNFIGAESYHPNQLGYRLLAQAILQQTSNLSAPMPQPVSVAAPSVHDPLAQVLLGGYQPDGTAVDVATYNDSFVPDFIRTDAGNPLDLSGFVTGLEPDTLYSVMIHSSPINLGSFTTDSEGNLRAQLTVPPGVSPGFHTIHIYGPNVAGQQVDIYKVVYVAANVDDYNGDGVPNSADQCLVVPLSGQDVDRDGIDDACDPVIDDAPSRGYPATATLSGNTIVIVNPKAQ